MWCDTFDADLLKVVPGALEALGETAAVSLTTRGHSTGGKINSPAAWNTYEGLMSFFWTAPGHAPDACWYTDHPEVACTFGEAVRDEWVHGANISVNGHIVWRPPQDLMMRLMYDLRGWTVLDEAKREEIREHVRRSLEAAAGRLREVLESAEAVNVDA